MGENLPVKTDSGLTLASLRQKKAEQARMSSLRRLGIHKVCLCRRALTSHLLRHFWCFAVLKLRFFVPARTKLQSILSYSQGFGRRRGEKDRFKTVCFLMSAGLTGCCFCRFVAAWVYSADSNFLISRSNSSALFSIAISGSRLVVCANTGSFIFPA